MKMHPDEYVKLAAVEDQMWYFQALHENIWRVLSARLPARASLLDAGCGAGGLIRRLGPRQGGWNWTGIDISPDAIGAARARQGKVDFVEGSMTALPFGAGTFDAVVSADSLMNIEDDRIALAEFARVLKPGGLLVLNVSALPWLSSYHDTAVGTLRRYGRAEVMSKLAAAGFQSIRASYTNFFPLPFVIIRRKLLPRPSSGSDVQVMPAPVEATFAALAGVERGILAFGGRLPIGTSVFAEAVRG